MAKTKTEPLEQSDDIKYKVKFLFGHSESQMRYRPDGERIVCEGRRIDRDLDGRITHIGEWSMLSSMIPARGSERAWRMLIGG
jgi:hypothetical protein